MTKKNLRKINRWKAVRKRAAAAVLLCNIVFLAAGCGRNSGKMITNAQGKQGVFREKEQTEQLSGLTTGDGKVIAMDSYDNILYVVADGYKEENYTVVLHTWDREGNKLGEASIFETALMDKDANAGIEPLNLSQNVSDFRITPQGNVLFTLNEIKTGENDETTGNKYLKCVDRTGKELFSLDIKSLTEEAEAVTAQSVVFSPDGTYVLAGQKIVELDAAGKIVNKYDFPEGYTDFYHPAFYYKGEPVFTIWNYKGETTTVKSLIFDFRTGKVKQELDIPQDILSGYSVYKGTEDGYDLILANTTGLYGYRIGEAEPTPVMNYIASGLPVSEFEHLCILNKTEVVCSYNDTVENKSRIAWMEYVRPYKVPDRQVMTLAMFGPDAHMLRKVVDFNKASEEYKILVKDYSGYAAMQDDKEGVTLLNHEIEAGRIPDLIYNTGSLDFRIYTDKGILADFYELIKADEEIKPEDYCTNVFKAFETDGKLYELPYNFCIETMVGKKSIFGDETSLTWEKLDRILAQYPEAGVFHNTVTREQVLKWALRYGMDDFMDQAKGVCNFDREEFRSLLAFVSKFPKTIEYDKLHGEDGTRNLQDRQFIQNAALLNSLTISSLDDIRNFTYGMFLEEAVPAGFPNHKGMGSGLFATGTFGISEQSVLKQPAWEFVRQFILPDAQVRKENDTYNIYNKYGLPVYKPALLEMASRMTERPSYIDSRSGEKVYYDKVVIIDGKEIVVEPASQQEAERWADFVLSVDKKVGNVADELLRIVNEEAEAYFDGQKSVEEVTKKIQSRVSAYISERR